ncbi:MAG TPA: hypothetical protein VM010_05665 [Chitinophagaceae bacterium]|nr:hypothetical protein [Chitinophagaceae bacterium]
MRILNQAVCGVCFLATMLVSSSVRAQGVAAKPVFKPDIKRALFHDNVDKSQKGALRADGRADNQFTLSSDDDINYLVTDALIQKVDGLQARIETDSLMDHRHKVAYLTGLDKMLKAFATGVRTRAFSASNWPLTLETYEAALAKDKMGESIQPIVVSKPYEVGHMLVASGAFDDNAGFKEANYAVLHKYMQSHPTQIFYTLKQNPDVPARDSLLLVAAYKYPAQLYDYAAANNRLGYAIQKLNDPLVKTITKMARSGGSGQMYFPFLDNILKGQQTIEEIDAVKGDDVKYFRLLVKTRLDYLKRQRAGESVYEMDGLTEKLERKTKEVFVKEINGLHESPDAVRFRILQQLTPQELYYIVVFSESEIYTSSFTRGVYPIMMQKMGNRGDSLLYSVGFDKFKKFIKMAAGYNTLNPFLKSFARQDDAQALMTAFVNGLDKSEGLEDGVDVADSYVSISEGNSTLAKFVLDLTKVNLDRALSQNNQRGIVMYNLLNKLFLSADSTNNINLSKEFGIPPVYTVKYEALALDSQQVAMQVFFYGDEDGRNNYAGFMRQFGANNWKKTENKQWVTLTSVRGKPIIIYANKPLDEEKGEDEQAQNALQEYLDERSIEPTIVVHRGHSYYAEATIEHIKPTAKIVFLGSCGGYHLIHDVLEHAPDAHIIASKQIGKGVINQPFFNLLMEKLRAGNDINWIPFWKEFGQSVTDKEGFSDYIPPHKNLGAIFIKAYKSQMGDDTSPEL